MPRSLLSFLIVGVLFPGLVRAQTRKVDCGGVVERLNKDFASQPGRLVLAVEDALTVNEACACPIVRQAVDLAGRDPVLTGEIVGAALRVSPSSAASIVECALEIAPEASPQIREAIDRVLGERASGLMEKGGQTPAGGEAAPGGKEPVGKEPMGKAPVGKESISTADTEDFESLTPVGISGIYLFSPANAPRVIEKEKREIIVKIVKRERRVLIPSAPVTPSHPESPPDHPVGPPD